MNLPLLLDAWAMWGVNIMDFVDAEQVPGPVASERRGRGVSSGQAACVAQSGSPGVNADGGASTVVGPHAGISPRSDDIFH